MLVSTNWIVGTITLVGGILCYVSKRATLNSAQSQPEIASTYVSNGLVCKEKMWLDPSGTNVSWEKTADSAGCLVEL